MMAFVQISNLKSLFSKQKTPPIKGRGYLAVPPFFAGNDHWSRQSLVRVNGRSPERLIAAGSGVDFGNPFERLTPPGASLKTR
jgi:hypothetical protein